MSQQIIWIDISCNRYSAAQGCTVEAAELFPWGKIYVIHGLETSLSMGGKTSLCFLRKQKFQQKSRIFRIGTFRFHASPYTAVNVRTLVWSWTLGHCSFICCIEAVGIYFLAAFEPRIFL